MFIPSVHQNKPLQRSLRFRHSPLLTAGLIGCFGVGAGAFALAGRDDISASIATAIFLLALIEHALSCASNASPKTDSLTTSMESCASQPEFPPSHAAQRDTIERRTMDHLPVLVAYVDKTGTIGFVNRTFKRWTGIEPCAVVGKTLEELVGSSAYTPHRDKLSAALKGRGSPADFEITTRGVRRIVHTEYVPDIGPQGNIEGIYLLGMDVTAAKTVQRHMSSMARTDALTQLPNRLSFNEKLRAAQGRQWRTHMALAVLYLDVDRFKSINDTYGHAVGDVVLKEFARRLRRCVRDTDTVARLGGDEFVVILEHIASGADAQVVASKVLAAFHEPMLIGNEALSIGTSIGIVFDPAGAKDPDSLLKAADAALYEAKRAGRGCFHLWTEKLVGETSPPSFGDAKNHEEVSEQPK